MKNSGTQAKCCSPKHSCYRTNTAQTSHCAITETSFLALTGAAVTEAAIWLNASTALQIWEPGLRLVYNPDSNSLPGVSGPIHFSVNNDGIRGAEKTKAGTNGWFSNGMRQHAYDAFNASLLEFCANHAFGCIDVNSMVTVRSGHFIDHIHFNDAGSRAVAKIVSAELLPIIEQRRYDPPSVNR